ncbi:MAG TPA: pre-peptidase C-terminal domain-containing protein, partial [Pyrinomonadaceae bacterium]
TTTGRRLNVANAVNAALENDAAAPAVPGNFRVTEQNGRRFTLAWTAPGDDGNSGAAADYDFFFIKPSGTSFLLPTTLVPANAGTQQTISVDVPLTNFNGRILLRAYDNVGNAGDAFVNVTIPISSKSDPYAVALSPSSGLAPLSGTRLVTGDDKYVSYELPFSFPFYGVNQTSLTLSTNGTLYFTPPPRRESGDADDAGSTIDGLQGKRMIAGLWDDIDINTSVRPDSGVYVTRPDAGRVVFRWQGVTFMTPRVNVNMEIELRSDGTIQMRYGENPRVYPVVGISGGEPEAYFISSHTSELENRNAFSRNLSDAQTITFTPRRLGTSVFTISGRVTDARGAGVPNVLIELFGEQSGSRLTDSNGDYSFTGLPEFGNYAVIPSRPNYKLTPTITEIASLTSDQKANFIATYNYFCTQTQQLNFGQTVNGALANGDCLNPAKDDGTLVDRYTFNGVAGQQVTISMSSTAVDTVLYLLDPEGSVLTYNDDVDPNSNPPNSNSRIVFTLPQSGLHSIIAGSFAPEERGAYTLSLSLNGTCNLTPINFNETKTGTLSAGDCVNEIENDNTFVDHYTFNGTAGQQISITMTGVSGNINPYLYLLSPSGVILANDDNGGGGLAARIVPGTAFGRLPATGTYTIVANTLLASQSGNYSITLTKATAD